MLLPQKLHAASDRNWLAATSKTALNLFSEVLFDLLKLAHGEPKTCWRPPQKRLATCGTFPWPGNWNWKLRCKLLALNWVTPIDLDVLCINWKGPVERAFWEWVRDIGVIWSRLSVGFDRVSASRCIVYDLQGSEWTPWRNCGQVTTADSDFIDSIPQLKIVDLLWLIFWHNWVIVPKVVQVVQMNYGQWNCIFQ